MEERVINTVSLNESPAFLRFRSCDYNTNDIYSTNHASDLVVSTYQLSKDNSAVRTGSILLLSSKDSTVNHRIETNGGVFRFELIPDRDGIVAALTSGRLSIIDLAKDKQHVSGIISGGIVLDVSWNKSTSKIICGDDYGELMFVDATSLEVQNRWMAHKSPYGLAVCEIWSCCWMNNNANICASGAEDGILKLWDVRGNCSKPQLSNSKSHNAGVVFVGSIAAGHDNELITGSYDEHIRIFDIRNVAKPVEEHKLSGGVWQVERMAVNDKDEELYLASCMYGGWCIVAKTAASRFKTVHVGRDQLGDESLLYGISSRRLADGHYRVASCTFNDKCVRVCEVTTHYHH